MYPYREFNPSRYAQRPWRRRASVALPWVFVLGIAAGMMLPARRWMHWPWASTWSQNPPRESDVIWKRAGNPSVRHPVDVIRTIDGDTFEARVHLWSGLDVMTRVRLRGIDAPELKAHCEKEFRMAEAASNALQNLLAEDEVTIFNIGPDKYQGRVDADVATRRTPNVSNALLAGGLRALMMAATAAAGAVRAERANRCF
jgi:endonuclease YncB( thermonuclease family)